MNYATLFDGLTESLKASPHAKVLESEFYLKAGIAPALLNQHHQLKPIGEALRVLNDNVLVWEFSGEPRMPAGEFHFYSLEQMLALPPVGDKLMVFDDHPQAGDGLMGCMKLVDTGYELWLYNENGKELQLELDLPGYFEALVKLRGVYGWQYFFTGAALMSPEHAVVRSTLKERLKRLHAAFPDEHYDTYMQKLD